MPVVLLLQLANANTCLDSITLIAMARITRRKRAVVSVEIDGKSLLEDAHGEVLNLPAGSPKACRSDEQAVYPGLVLR